MYQDMSTALNSYYPGPTVTKPRVAKGSCANGTLIPMRPLSLLPTDGTHKVVMKTVFICCHDINEHSTHCLIGQFSFQADALSGYRDHNWYIYIMTAIDCLFSKIYSTNREALTVLYSLVMHKGSV